MPVPLEERLRDDGARLATEPVPPSSAFEDAVAAAPQAQVPPPPMDTDAAAESPTDACRASASASDTPPVKPKKKKKKKRKRVQKEQENTAELSSQPSDASTALVLAAPRSKKKKTDRTVSTVVNKRVANQYDEMRKSLLPNRRVRFCIDAEVAHILRATNPSPCHRLIITHNL